MGKNVDQPYLLDPYSPLAVELFKALSEKIGLIVDGKYSQADAENLAKFLGIGIVETK